MIKTSKEYARARKLHDEQKEALAQEKIRLEHEGLKRKELGRVWSALEAPLRNLAAELKEYEELREGHLEAWEIPFESLGVFLIKLRISRGLTQRELAKRLAVHESQVSRDERNDYHGITVERARRILEMLGTEYFVCVKSPGKRIKGTPRSPHGDGLETRRGRPLPAGRRA
jgi:hypothetical protein